MGGERQDLDVFGFSAYDHDITGSIDQGPPLGGTIQGGVFLTPDATLSAEVSFRAPNSGRVTERIKGHTTTEELSGRYTDRTRLTSILAGGRLARGPAIDAHMVGGLAISTRTHSLTDRAGIYFYPGGQLPTEGRDFTKRETTFGLVGGADVLTSVGASISAVWSARIHWTGTLTIQLGAGLSWGR